MGKAILFLLFSTVAYCAPSAPQRRAGAVPQIQNVKLIGTASSNLPNIYRDGGGGGTINGQHLMMFSDGLYTSGGVTKPDLSNLVNFTSNSIACSNCDGKGIASLTDWGTLEKGPVQAIPYFYSEGESEYLTGIWPNQGLTSLCDGQSLVSFPQVVNRSALRANLDGTLYNTGVEIRMTSSGPQASRPVQIFFTVEEPQFGSFGTYASACDKDWLYMFARVSQTAQSNGLKMARAPQTAWQDRSKYQYWDGRAWSSHMPRLEDGGVANIFNWSQAAFGKNYGPGAGDLFWSPHYNSFMMLFQSDNGLDSTVWMSSSTTMERGWSTPQAIYNITTLDNGFSYSFHAYPNYDATGKVIPISWTQYQPSATFIIAMANITFV